MKFNSDFGRRKLLYILPVILLMILIVFGQPHSVAAVSVDHFSSGSFTMVRIENPAMPPSEPTPTPQATLEGGFNPDDVSITLIFETIIKWLFGKDLTEIFNDVEWTEEQQKQVELLTGEKNPLNLVNNFCAQVRAGDFARMADSVRESNRDDGSGAISPAILMDFFEQLGAFCPAE